MARETKAGKERPPSRPLVMTPQLQQAIRILQIAVPDPAAMVRCEPDPDDDE
jgi:hypothetical protein